LQEFEKKMLRKMAGLRKTLGYRVARNFVICTGHLVLLSQINKECIQNFGGETTCRINKKIEDNIKKDFMEMVCDIGRRMEVIQDHI